MGRSLEFLVLAAGLVMASSCGVEEPPAVIRELSGEVSVNGSLLTEGRALSAGDSVHTAKGAFCRVVYADGSTFRLVGLDSWGTTLEVTRKQSGAAQVLVRLVEGTLSFLVPPERRKPDKYDVEARNTVTAIEGTSGKIQTLEVGDTIALATGKVRVTARATGLQKPLEALQVVKIDLKGAFGKPQDYDPYSSAETPYFQFGGNEERGFGSGR